MQRFEQIYEEHREAVRAYARRRAPEAVVDDVVADVFVVCLRRIEDAFAELSERDREVLRLVAWEGLSLKEAASVLGCSAIAARVRFHRAKSRLAVRLDAAASFRPAHEGVSR